MNQPEAQTEPAAAIIEHPHAQSAGQILSSLSATASGLSNPEVARRQQQYRSEERRVGEEWSVLWS